MSSAAALAVVDQDDSPAWWWPIDLDRYNRRPELTGPESAALMALGMDLRRGRCHDRDAAEWDVITRLLRPLDDAQRALGWLPATRHHRRSADDAIGMILMRCARENSSFWAWSSSEWLELIGPNSLEFQQTGWLDGSVRPYLTAHAYQLCGFTDFHRLGKFNRVALAWRVFGRAAVDKAIRGVTEILRGWGYRSEDQRLLATICQALLLNRSPRLADLSTEAFERLRSHPAMTRHHLSALFSIQRAAAGLGHANPPPMTHCPAGPMQIDGAPPAWTAWVDRWYATSTLTPKVRGIFRSVLAKLGRWLVAEHPEVVDPEQWTRQLCANWVAAVDRMTVGEYVQRQAGLAIRLGTPLSPRTKAGYLTATRAFFRDLQEWEWIRRRFDPVRALATPRSVHTLIGPNPRVIADDVWAKLLSAGLNIEPEDFPVNSYGLCYPMELVRAVTVTWLFSGLRSDEIARLRVGCVRWQHDGMPIPGDSAEVLARDAVCLLDVPTQKTGTAFTKPVDPLLGKAIEAWQAVRPEQPGMLDRKTGERVDFAFAFRARRVGATYINHTIIPALCDKAGVPNTDVRGNITSHRARSTIASQLYNAKEPMTLFELQAWLNHRVLSSTQHYAKITPNTLAKAYNDAGYFARNLRTIEVLIDRDAITSGAAAAGMPWQHYDLGHGYCTYTFFEQCPHRMACARCDFYTPKASSKGQLLEAKENLQRMLANIPLTDEERAAVDDGQAALDQLLERLVDVRTPSGATPREIGIPATATLLPITVLNQDKQE
ncbi:MAG: tyrosine-type recombinase/integrase [Streptosporangiaceae bacterium]|nr:tyrosine-type recombinase/integrase [Streptosporangiaceae bacterium]